MPAVPQAMSLDGVVVLELGPEYRLIDEAGIGATPGCFREKRLREAGPRPLVLDLSQVSWACSSFLGLLARWWSHLADEGEARLGVCGLSSALRNRLVVIGLIALWPVFCTRADAIAALQDHR